MDEKEPIFPLSEKDKEFIISFLGAIGEMDAMKNIIRGKKLPRSIAQFAVCRTAKKRPELVLKGYGLARDRGEDIFRHLLKNKDVGEIFKKR